MFSMGSCFNYPAAEMVSPATATLPKTYVVVYLGIRPATPASCCSYTRH